MSSSDGLSARGAASELAALDLGLHQRLPRPAACSSLARARLSRPVVRTAARLLPARDHEAQGRDASQVEHAAELAELVAASRPQANRDDDRFDGIGES